MSQSHLKEQEVSMLRKEIEMLMSERHSLLGTTGAAAFFIANLDSRLLPDKACEAASILSKTLNNLPEDTLCEALEKVQARLTY
jgi:hypothetical protein